jgi:hypothetical protein
MISPFMFSASLQTNYYRSVDDSVSLLIALSALS